MLVLSDPKLFVVQEVQEAIDSLSVGRTVLLIAHRLSTISSADKIVVLNKGMVLEEGPHVSLSEAGGEYAALLASQFSSTMRADSATVY